MDPNEAVIEPHRAFIRQIGFDGIHAFVSSSHWRSATGIS
jgi:hypothetical protein